jgi:hypothetical protein
MEYPISPLCIQFSKTQQITNSRVSDFLGLSPTEKTNRPIYYHFKKLEYKGQKWDALYYVLFYQYNPGYKVLWKTLGFHEADVEKLIVLYSKDTKEPTWVYFGAHGRGQGIWLEYNKCKFTENGTLKVFVSPTSHAFYPQVKRYWRLCFVANDVCDEQGEEWTPSPICFEPSENQVWSNTHYQVRPGINSPFNTPSPNEHSIKTWERILLFLPSVRKRIRI